jgi:hypothetical protein
MIAIVITFTAVIVAGWKTMAKMPTANSKTNILFRLYSDYEQRSETEYAVKSLPYLYPIKLFN